MQSAQRLNLIDFACRLFDGAHQDFELDLARWCEQMAGQGPDHLVATAVFPDEIELVIRAAALHPEHFSAFAAANPTDQATAALVVQALAEGSLRGAMLFPGIHGVPLDSELHKPLFETAQAQRRPLIVHCGMPPAILRDQSTVQLSMHAANPLELIPIAARYPEIPFVIPAFGAGFFRETLMAGEVCENIYTSTAGSGAWLRTQSSPMTLEDVIERSLGVFGAERVLFATGSGPGVAGWRSDLATLQREAMGALEVKPMDMLQVLTGNAQRILGLMPPAA